MLSSDCSLKSLWFLWLMVPLSICSPLCSSHERALQLMRDASSIVPWWRLRPVGQLICSAPVEDVSKLPACNSTVLTLPPPLPSNSCPNLIPWYLFWWCETGHVSAVRTYTHMLTQSEVCLRLLSSHSPLVSKTNIHFSVSLLAMAGPRPVVFSGPSGAGKSTLLKKLMKEYDSVFGFSVSRKCVTFRAGRRAPVGLWGQWM